jgi:hypothetical protein
MKKTLINQADMVNKYLYNVGKVIGDVYNDKETCKKDKKWLQDNVISIIKVMNFIDIIIALDKNIKNKKDKK